MASVKGILCNREYNPEEVDISFLNGQFITEMLASEEKWNEEISRHEKLGQEVHKLEEKKSQDYIQSKRISIKLSKENYEQLKSQLDSAENEEERKNIKQQIDAEKQKLYDENKKYLEQDNLDGSLSLSADEIANVFDNLIDYQKKCAEYEELEKKLQGCRDLFANGSEDAKKTYDVYNSIKDDPKKLEDFKKLYGLMQELNDSDKFQKGGKRNDYYLSDDQDGISLRIKNVGGSGLNMAIKDGKILVVENDGLNEFQVAMLADFVEENEFDIQDASSIKDLKITNKNGEEIGTFEQVYNDYTDLSEYAGMTLENLNDKLAACPGYDEYTKTLEAIDKLFAVEKRTPEQQAELERLQILEKSFEPKLQKARDRLAKQEDRGEAIGIKGTNAPGHEEDDLEQEGQKATERESSTTEGKVKDGSTDVMMGADEGNERASFSTILAKADEKRPEYMTYREMSGPILYRAGIARIDKKCLVRRRMPDGSYMIAWYASEADKYKDCKIDPKTGIAQHTKKVAFFLRKRPPGIEIYIPQTSKFEGSYAKAALGSLKAMGYKYFKMPAAGEFGGDACGAFWEAAGDQLVCPKLKRSDNDDGCTIGNDDLEKLLKAMKEKNKSDDKLELEFKMRLVEELRGYIAYVESKGKEESKLEDSMKALEGDIRFHNFGSCVLSDLNKKIREGTREENWNAVDIACAYKAEAEIAKAVNKGVITYKDDNGNVISHPYDYLHPDKNSQAIDAAFKYHMKQAEARVIQDFKKKCKPGGSTEGTEDDHYDYEDQDTIDKFKQQNFDKASNDLVRDYAKLVKDTLSEIAGKYPGAEKLQKLEPENIAAVPTINMGAKSKDKIFANVKPGRQGASTSSPSGRIVGGATR